MLINFRNSQTAPDCLENQFPARALPRVCGAYLAQHERIYSSCRRFTSSAGDFEVDYPLYSYSASNSCNLRHWKNLYTLLPNY